MRLKPYLMPVYERVSGIFCSMHEVNSYIYIIAACLLVIISYLYNLFSTKTGIPSVLLLLLTGICIREVLLYRNVSFNVPAQTVELFGILGLIMIVLEAGLDLQVRRNKLKLIRNAFLSAFFILTLSSAACSALLYIYLKEDYLRCLIYAIPLSVVSSAIVIPSISHLQENKKEFLVYETSFSDIIGIMLFNYIIAGNILKTGNITLFFGSLILAIALSIILSLLILRLLTRIRTKVRFFLVFSILILLYAGGKTLHLPSLFIILLFGLIVSNWHLSVFKKFYKWVADTQVREVGHFLHALTAESSFLIRTFFFFAFGLTIDIRLLLDIEVALAGTLLIVAALVFMSMSVSAQTNTDSFKVYGNCGMCKNRIEKATKLEGVSSAVWNADTKEMVVAYDSTKVSNDEIQKKIASVGHDTGKYSADDKVYRKLPGCCLYDRKKADKQNDHSGRQH